MNMPSHTPLHGRHALVTGPGTGIGAAIASAIAEAGGRLSLAGRRREPLLALAAKMASAETTVIDGFDVTDPERIAAGIATAHAKFGAIDILVNNAGQAPSAAFLETDLALWNRVLSVNLTGVFVVTRQVLPDMLAKRAGRIVTIASTAGLVGYRYVSAYVAAKHGVVGLTRALALEVAKTGITVNAVCPGYTDTALLADAIETIAAKSGRSRGNVLKSFTSANPQGRLVKPEEVADAVMWLLSGGASAINGQAIAVAGGEVMVG